MAQAVPKVRCSVGDGPDPRISYVGVSLCRLLPDVVIVFELCFKVCRLWNKELLDLTGLDLYSIGTVTSGSPSRGGNVVLCVKEINQPSFSTLFFFFLFFTILFLGLFFCLYGTFNCISFHKFSR